MADQITLNLSTDEALVLFELLSRHEDDSKLSLNDVSEEHVLSILLGKLEVILVEPFRPNYSELLQIAQDKIKHQFGSANE